MLDYQLTHLHDIDVLEELYSRFVHELTDDEAISEWALSNAPYTKRNRRLIASMPWLSYITILDGAATDKQIRYLKEACLDNGDRLFVLPSSCRGIEYRAYKINGTGRSQTPEGVSCDQALAIQAALSWLIKVRA